MAQCDCPVTEPTRQKSPSVRPRIRLDRSGRKGKVVTLVGALPDNDAYLKDLAKELKARTGSGGTFYVAENAGTIELQGDHMACVTEFFKQLNKKAA